MACVFLVLFVLLGSAAQTSIACSAASGSSEGMLLSRSIVPDNDVAQILAAESAAWVDSFLVEHGLTNRTRRISGSRGIQAVTWLHRSRAHAGGAIERVESSALSMANGAGWRLQMLGPLHLRCVESIRYAVTDDAGDGEGDDLAHTHDDGGVADDEGWHQDEWSVLTAVVVLSTTPDVLGGDMELDRGRAPTECIPELKSGDMVVFRSW